MKQSNSFKNKQLRAGLAMAALTTTVVVVAVLTSTSSSTVAKSSQVSKVPTATQTSQTQTTSSSTTYKDGTYMATGSYYSPGGKEMLHVSLTLSNNVITDSTVTSGANDPTAISYQTLFISGYKQKVIGKPISSVKLSNVSGSSLTTQGFQDALKQIEKQAKA